MFTVAPQHKGLHFVRYEATTSLLHTILIALESPIEDRSWWKVRTDIAFLCLLEMTSFVAENSPGGTRNDLLIFWSIELAIPHLRDMAVAMVRNDRAGAVHAGTIAFQRLTQCQQYWVDPLCLSDAASRIDGQTSRAGEN